MENGGMENGKNEEDLIDRPVVEQAKSIEKMIAKQRKKEEKEAKAPKPKTLKIKVPKEPKEPKPKTLKIKVPKEVNVPNPNKKTLKIKVLKEPRETKLATSTVDQSISDKKPKFDPPYNKLFIQVLEDLLKLMKKKRDNVHQLAYKRAIETVRGITEDITRVDQLKGKKFIGPIIISKMEEYLQTGTLQLFEREKAEPGYAMNEVYEQFSNIYGVGPKKAQDLIDKGIKSMDELREKQGELLNESQKAGLKYYDDILKRIPRKEIDEYNDVFKKTLEKVLEKEETENKDARYEIVGSYRRGLPESGDIDMILTSPNKSLFKKFTDALLEESIILETLSSGASKCLVIARLPNRGTARRVDFLYSSPEEFPFAILYFTGSKEFNTVMRAHALTMGVTLNEHGLSKKEPGKKKEEMIADKFMTEQDIFTYLDLEYKEPTERIGGQAVISTAKEVNQAKAGLDKYEATVWKRGNYDESCDEVCAKEDGKCDVSQIATLDSEDKISKLALATGAECLKHLSVESTPFLEDYGGKGCWHVKKGSKATRKWCTKKSAQWNTNLCPCKTKKKGKKEPNESKESKPVKIPGQKREKIANDLKESAVEIVPIITEGKTKSSEGTQGPIEKPIKLKIKLKKEGELNKTRKKSNDKKIEKTDINHTGDNNQPGKMDTRQIITKFKESGISVLDTLPEKTLAQLISVANMAYHNTEHPLMTDNEYDIVKEYTERKFPKSTVLEQIGAPIIKNKVTLPFNMPSMDKIKPDSGALTNWTKKYTGPYVLSCKLDGVSGMYVSDEAKLYTRGDGHVGQDISHLLSTLNLPKVAGLVVRGEFIMPKAVFEEKYKGKFANPRNLVSGIINSKTIDEKTKDLHFVTYEVIEPSMKPSEQMSTLSSNGFETVQNKSEQSLTNEVLSEVLKDWRTNYEYEIDGVIVSDDHIHSRIDGNPDYAFAFKMVMSDQIAEAKVVDVLWEASKAGYLKPRVRIEPIRLGGVTIEYATGFNGKFIEENKIGIGAVIQIIRSGDVIPHIKAVTTPAEHAKMPAVTYHWTDTHVDIILDNINEDITVREKNITAFFTTLEVDGLSGGNVKRIMKSGFDSIAKILSMSKDDFEKVDGFKQKMADKLYDGIKTRVEKASLLKIMVASNMLGRGLGARKIGPILEAQPDILISPDSAESKIVKLLAIPGIGPENAKIFVANIGVFMEFLKECGLEGKLSAKNALKNELQNTLESASEIDKSNPLFGKHIVMTKTRDATCIEKIKRAGAILDDGIGKNTFILIVKSKEDVSNKTKVAKERGITILTPEEFNQMY